jgi:hypothetical protein
MTDKKISELPAASAIAGTEEIPVVQSAATVKSTPAAIKTYLNGAANTWTGVQQFGAIGGAVGKFVLAGSTSGSTIVNAAAIAGSTTMTFPGTTGTVAVDAVANVFSAAQTFALEDSGTNTVLFPATIRRTSSGTPANGIGVGQAFEVETSAGNNEIGATVRAIAEDTTSTSEDFGLSVSTMVAGSTTLVESARFVNGRIYNYGLGTAALPAYSFDIGGNRAYGMWYSAGAICFSINGTQKITIAAGSFEVCGIALVNYLESVNARTSSGSENAGTVGGNISTTTTNAGATALVTRTLPSAAAGLVYRFACLDADGIKVAAAAGDEIRVIDKVTAAAGYIQSTTIGSFVEVMAMDATTWLATRILGVWTDGTFTYDDTSLTTP